MRLLNDIILDIGIRGWFNAKHYVVWHIWYPHDMSRFYPDKITESDTTDNKNHAVWTGLDCLRFVCSTMVNRLLADYQPIADDNLDYIMRLKP